MRVPAVLLLLVLAAATSSEAQERPLAQVVARSDRIVLARCTQTSSRWDDAAHVIVTDVTLAVDRTIKGNHSEAITVRTLGGRVGATGMGTSHATHFTPGAAVVALLRQSRFGPYFVVAASDSSVFPVSPDHRIAAGPNGVEIQTFMDWLQATTP